MIEHLSNFPDDVLAFVCKGRVTKAESLWSIARQWSSFANCLYQVSLIMTDRAMHTGGRPERRHRRKPPVLRIILRR